MFLCLKDYVSSCTGSFISRLIKKYEQHYHLISHNWYSSNQNRFPSRRKMFGFKWRQHSEHRSQLHDSEATSYWGNSTRASQQGVVSQVKKPPRSSPERSIDQRSGWEEDRQCTSEDLRTVQASDQRGKSEKHSLVGFFIWDWPTCLQLVWWCDSKCA